MRIINISSNPQHFSFAGSSSGGRTLKPGESSPELPLVVGLNPLLLKSLEANIIRIRLSEKDKFVLERLQSEDARAIPEVKPVVKAKKKAEAGKKRSVIPAGIPVNPPGSPKGMPVFNVEVRPPPPPGSLAALQLENEQLRKQAKLAEVAGLTGSRV